MNDIAKKATAEKFLRALEKEGISKAEAGASIGFTAAHVSYLFNEKYWPRLGIKYWDKLLKWVNSGQSLKEYAEKHGKVLAPEKPVKFKISTAGEKDSKAFPEKTIETSDIKPAPELIKKFKTEFNESPLIRVPNQEFQKVRTEKKMIQLNPLK
jgi:hypothetical protein